ncbi:hypothetical protein BE20_0024 [Staphylococcus phage vB_SepS_BE20]|nr:hypothetical protein BE20_0024 [Staphylococcus phage vB_SepS_BE20]
MKINIRKSTKKEFVTGLIAWTVIIVLILVVFK